MEHLIEGARIISAADEPESRPSLSGDGHRLYFGCGATADVCVSTRAEIDD